MLIGAHVSSSGGLAKAHLRGVESGSEAIQIFNQSPRMWRPTAYSGEDLAAFRALMGDGPVRSVVIHAVYLINCAAKEPEIREKSVASLVHALRIGDAIGAAGVVLHPGSKKKQEREESLELVADVLRFVLQESESCPLLLEDTAGAGDTLGRTFEELADLVERAGAPERLGLCLDSCHLLASGFDIATAEGLGRVVDDCDRLIGLDRLRCLHVNDSKTPLASNRDRHETLAEGELGRQGIGAFLSEPRFEGLPTLLETPGADGKTLGAAEVATARELRAEGLSARRAGHWRIERSTSAGCEGSSVLLDTTSQVWPAFVLVAGLLLIGRLSEAEDVFEWAASLLVRAPGGTPTLFASCLLLVALVTAVLNLDTAVVFLTPIILAAARRCRVSEEPFLYGTVFMANASSLFLPGANLTNLLVLRHEAVSGGTFALRLFPAAATAAVVTAAGLAVLFRNDLAASPARAELEAQRPRALSLVTVAVAGGLTLALRSPALPVLGLGLVAAGVAVQRKVLGVRTALAAAAPLPLLGLFVLSVGLGTLGRVTDVASLLDHAGVWTTAVASSLAAVGLNNLPAAVLLSTAAPAHPRALLLGLNVGPNLAVTGSLSSYLWLRAARSAGARPSIREFSRRGLLLAPAAIAAALVAQATLAPGGL